MKKKIINILIITFISIQVQAQDIKDIEKKSVLNSVIDKIDKIYPFPEVSENTTIGLQTQISNGMYDKISSQIEFASQVTSDLEEFSNDKHLDLIYDPELAIALIHDSESEDSGYTKEEAKIEVWNNYGFKELSILDGNIGYLNLGVFFATEYAGKTADVAMNFFLDCNGLIIDLRQNGGGWGDMVEYLLGYFIDIVEPLLINISQSTLDRSYYSSVVPGYVPGQKLTNIPIYILTSPTTASAAEAFTTHIKYFNKNVTIVGNKTAGAENPVDHVAINNNFVLQIPSWKRVYSRNPNVWEGIGIEPDIEVDAEDAKKVAHILVLEKLIDGTKDKIILAKYHWALDSLHANYENINIENIDKYVGNYDNIRIINKSNKLYYQYKERPFKQLIPISNDYFIVEEVDYYRLKFINDNGETKLKQILSFGSVREYSKE